MYYTAGLHGVYQHDTWWQQTADALDLRLLVNNSWSGSCMHNTHSGTVGATHSEVDEGIGGENDTPILYWCAGLYKPLLS